MLFRSNMEFFIINDGIISKLCILGDDIEPCFEGGSVTAAKISKDFTNNNEQLISTLFTMMEELKDYLKDNKGGNTVEGNIIIEEPVIATPAIEEPVIVAPVIEEPIIEEPIVTEPVIVTPVIEEPIIEEPVIVEPVIEEPVIVEGTKLESVQAG